jgi:NADH-quinone oxidoreductase subunit N
MLPPSGCHPTSLLSGAAGLTSGTGLPDIVGQSSPLLTGDEAIAFAPLLALALTAMVLFLVDTIDPDAESITAVASISVLGTLSGLGVALAHLFGRTGVDLDAASREGGAIGNQLVVDELSLFFTVIVTTVTVLVLVAAVSYFDDHRDAGTFYSLVLLAATGMVSMAHANSLVTVFIALELASLPSYALVAFSKHDRGSVEAGMKYFLIGALSSAIFLYGISLVYGATGTLLLDGIAEAVQDAASADGEYEFAGILGIGILMLLGGFAFKTASVPVHFWAPEAYEGSPTPVSALLSSASKAAGFVIAFRVLVTGFPIGDVSAVSVDWSLVFVVLAVLTMVIGNFAAALQTRVKRMLAYSSVAHAGYVLIAFAALSEGGGFNNELLLAAGMIHLLVYGVMNTGAFLFVALAETWDVGRTFTDYNGLGTEAPVAAGAMTILLVNLAGIPIGGGFWGKYLLFTGAVGGEEYLLAGVLVVTSALSLYYYARLIKAMWLDTAVQSFDIEDRPITLYAPILACAAITVLLLGAVFVFQDPAMDAAAELLAGSS